MAKVQVFDMKKKAVAEREISDAVFNADVKEYLIHDMVRYQLAKRRSGTATVKNRAAVAGGGKKPYKQKGTGNARQGTIRAPHFVGGGVVFGPQQRSYEFKLNRKVKQAALRSALSARFKEDQLFVVDQISLDAPSTKGLLEFLGAFEAESALVVVESANAAVELSARNLEKVKVLRSEGVNVYDVMKHQKLILSAGAVANLEGVLG